MPRSLYSRSFASIRGSSLSSQNELGASTSRNQPSAQFPSRGLFDNQRIAWARNGQRFNCDAERAYLVKPRMHANKRKCQDHFIRVHLRLFAVLHFRSKKRLVSIRAFAADICDLDSLQSDDFTPLAIDFDAGMHSVPLDRRESRSIGIPRYT